MRKITTLDMTTYSVVKPKQKVAAYIRVSTLNEEWLKIYCLEMRQPFGGKGF